MRQIQNTPAKCQAKQDERQGAEEVDPLEAKTKQDQGASQQGNPWERRQGTDDQEIAAGAEEQCSHREQEDGGEFWYGELVGSHWF